MGVGRVLYVGTSEEWVEEIKRESGEEVVMAPPFTSLQNINSANPEENYAVAVARKAAECRPDSVIIEADIYTTLYSVEEDTAMAEAKADAYKIMHMAWALSKQTNIKKITVVKRINLDNSDLTDIVNSEMD